MHRRTTQEGGEELSQILTPYHQMRGSLSRLRNGKTSTEGIPKHLLWTEAYPGEEEPFLLANEEELGIMIFATDRDLYSAAHSDVIAILCRKTDTGCLIGSAKA
ncbi:hypothetical protein L596_019129 [Steinernema carpocapsae]|uniref:Uncharacterized protein n=1 Tax=Steinernema carpocapsae TaxID=34508 RepID=A0A4U5N7U0_STECR|nr:hypothetical protein L596_019129 [Steinernema carpocapsae]